MSDAPSDPTATPPVDPGPAPQQPAGWYPDGAGGQRYWDGAQWTEHALPVAATPTVAYGQSVQPMAPTDEKNLATIAQAVGIFSWIAPLVLYLTSGNRSAYVKHHCAESLNFAITVFVALMICIPLMFVLIGFLLLPVVWIGSIVLQIMAAMAANRGEWYRYPVSIRLVPGAYGS